MTSHHQQQFRRPIVALMFNAPNANDLVIDHRRTDQANRTLEDERSLSSRVMRTVPSTPSIDEKTRWPSNVNSWYGTWNRSTKPSIRNTCWDTLPVASVTAVL